MFDFPKALSAVADVDSRLEQVANQQKITNGLLALLVLAEANRSAREAPMEGPFITPDEQATCIALARTAFNDHNRT